MKIILIHQYFNVPSSGGSTRPYDLAKKFLENGYEVTVVTSGNNFSEKLNGRWANLNVDNIDVHVLNMELYSSAMSATGRIRVFLTFVWYTCFKLLKLKGDIVIASSTPLTIGIPALVKKWVQKTPFIFEARDMWPENVVAIGAIKNKFLVKAMYFLESLIYKNANALVPLSTDMKHSVVTRYNKLKYPIEVIENISELNRFQNGYDPNISVLEKELGFKPRFSILYAGTYGKVNGLSYAIELAAKLLPIDPTIAFILVGGGPEEDQIRELAKEREVLGKNVHMLNPVSKNQLAQYYYEVQMGSSFVIAIEELWANSANKFFDSLAASRPMLINHEGWQKKVLLDNDAGYILSHNLEEINEADLTDFVSYTKDDEKQKRQMQNAFQLAHKYSLEAATEKYIKLFNYIRQSLNGS